MPWVASSERSSKTAQRVQARRRWQTVDDANENQRWERAGCRSTRVFYFLSTAFDLAHRAFCAFEIAFRAFADIFRRERAA
jgi:hypothetical protein